MRLATLCLICFGVVVTDTALAQGVQDDVFLTRSFEEDARVAQTPYFQAGLLYNTYEFFTYSLLGVTAGIPLSPAFEIAAAADYTFLNPEFGDGSSGLADIVVHGKYNFSHKSTRLSLGAFFTLPVGSDEVGEGDVDVGVFVAARHPLQEGTVLTGKVSVDYFEIDADDSDPSLRFHGGIIQRAGERIAVLGELLISSDVTLALLSGGLNYALGSSGHLRGSIAIGLNDSSPDLSFIIGFLNMFGR